MSVEKLYLDINQVRSKFASWRAGKTVREAMPQKLWRLAIKLLDYYPKRIVCRELRLNSTRLDKHRLALEQNPLAPTESKSRKKEPFLELSPQALISASVISPNNSTNNVNNIESSTSKHMPQIEQAKEANKAASELIVASDQECRLVLEKKDGSRLTISLPLEWTRIEALCANLLRA